MLRESRLGNCYRKWIDGVAVPFLSHLAVKPDHLSLAGLWLSLLAIPAYSYALWLGGIVILVSGGMDTLDGSLARKASQPSPSGAFLDSVLDRYSDFFSVLGVWLFYFFHPSIDHQRVITALLFLYLSGSFLVSYSRARGEGLGLSVSIGCFGRAERIIILGLGSILTDLLAFFFRAHSWASNRHFFIAILFLLVIGSHLTALKRIVFLLKNLNSSGRA